MNSQAENKSVPISTPSNQIDLYGAARSLGEDTLNDEFEEFSQWEVF